MARAFSLIELLVVLGIVAILAAILFPVVARAKMGGLRTSCATNLRQIGQAQTMYAADSNDVHPTETRVEAVDGWAAQLLPYLGSSAVLQCPAEPTAARTDPRSLGFSDYFYGRYVLGRSGSDFSSPAGTIVVMDGISGGTANWEDGTDHNKFIDCKGDSRVAGATPGVATWLSQLGDEPRLNYSKRHANCANYLLADGHVKAYEPNSVQNNCTNPVTAPSFAWR